MPILSRLQTKHAGNGVQIVGIALDTADNVAQYAAMRPASYPLLTGDANATNLSRLLGNSQLALPYTVVFNRDGTAEMTGWAAFPKTELDSLLERSRASSAAPTCNQSGRAFNRPFWTKCFDLRQTPA